MAEHSELLARLRAVKPPPAVLDRERERRLTTRQREILDHLGEMFDDGFAGLTMATIAARSNCSLRTLYGLAPSRDELVLIVVDRNLWRVGRGAKEMITPQMEPLEALQAYLEAANEAVDGMTVPFARDLASMPAAQRQWELHAGYLVEIARCLLMAGLGVELSRPAVMPTLQTSPKQAAGSIVSLMILGLRASRTAAATAVPTRQAPRRKGAA
jgi:AcrR family transcriptional regulator